MDTPSTPGRLEEEIAALRRELAAHRINVSGKDWLTVEEAASYCGVSRSQFDSHIKDYGIEPRNFMSKKLYEKAALYRAISEAKPWSTFNVRRHASTTRSPEVAAAVAKLGRYERRLGHKGPR